MSISACLIGAGFLAASVYTSLAKNNSSVFADFQASLTDEQKAIHADIQEERKTLYITGIILGVVIAVAYLYFFGPETTTKKTCFFVVIMMAVTHFYYLLSPKSTYMVYHLKSQDQAHLWNQVNKEMQKRHTLGFLIGMAGYALITWGSTQFAFPRPDEILDGYF